jgi:hypothetical protein
MEDWENDCEEEIRELKEKIRNIRINNEENEKEWRIIRMEEKEELKEDIMKEIEEKEKFKQGTIRIGEVSITLHNEKQRKKFHNDNIL